jgi:hypothetical protein
LAGRLPSRLLQNTWHAFSIFSALKQLLSIGSFLLGWQLELGLQIICIIVGTIANDAMRPQNLTLG